jgi:predicted membrane GTPase involved in stress response
MTGETKQMIAVVRKEFQEILNLVENPGADPEEFIDGIVERIKKFDEHLKSIDLPVVYDIPPLGISVGDIAPSKDKFC